MEVTDINLGDPGYFVPGVPHDWFSYLRRRHRSSGTPIPRASPRVSGR